jgi:hypothetical protein
MDIEQRIALFISTILLLYNAVFPDLPEDATVDDIKAANRGLSVTLQIINEVFAGETSIDMATDPEEIRKRLTYEFPYGLPVRYYGTGSEHE